MGSGAFGLVWTTANLKRPLRLSPAPPPRKFTEYQNLSKAYIIPNKDTIGNIIGI